MKKILTIIWFAAVIVSCAKIEVVETENYRVGFDTYALRTRAGDSYIGGDGNNTRNIPVNSKFGVFAYFHPGNAGTNTVGVWNTETVNANTSNLMLNQWVQRIEPSEGTYGYYYPAEDSRYWPKNETDRISFFAYYPYAANAFVVDENAQSDGTGITLQDPDDDHYGFVHNPVGFPKFKFVVNPDASKQVDFMISDMCLNQSKRAGVLTGDGDVRFTFHHMLSQVRIRTVGVVKENESVDVQIDSFRFVGVPKSGICTPSVASSPDANGLATMGFAWTGLNSSNSRFTASIYDPDASDAAKQAAVMLMIPHRFNEDDPTKDIFEVFFRVTRSDYQNMGEHYEYSGHLSTPLGSGGLVGWERNKIYNYTIRVSLKSIDFSTEVEDWPEASTDVNTIKVDLESEENQQ